MSRGRTVLSHTAELVLFAMLGTLMFVSKVLMNGLPNIHLVGVLTMVYTLVFRGKALIPIYVYAFLVLWDFGLTPYWGLNLYVWTVLWAVTMLLPKRMPKKVAVPVTMAVCGLHGLCFGLLCAPLEAAVHGLSFKGTVTWVLVGLVSFPAGDITHAVSNCLLGTMIVPLTVALQRAVKQIP